MAAMPPTITVATMAILTTIELFIWGKVFVSKQDNFVVRWLDELSLLPQGLAVYFFQNKPPGGSAAASAAYGSANAAITWMGKNGHAANGHCCNSDNLSDYGTVHLPKSFCPKAR